MIERFGLTSLSEFSGFSRIDTIMLGQVRKRNVPAGFYITNALIAKATPDDPKYFRQIKIVPVSLPSDFRLTCQCSEKYIVSIENLLKKLLYVLKSISIIQELDYVDNREDDHLIVG